jgi:hypothetical protein
MQDKELMVLPLLSGGVIVAIIVGFFFATDVDLGRLDGRQADVETMLPVFLVYVATYVVGVFFQAAVVAGATERLRGGDPTLGSALRAAARRFPSILLWAVVAATVGTLLHMIRDRAGFIGRIVVSLAGAAWSLATFFVVPVIVLEDASVGEAIPESAATFKRAWGETFVGGVNLAAASVVAWVTLVAIVGLLAWAGAGILAVVAGVAGAIAILIFFSALQGVFVASLYRFAAHGEAGAFDRGVLEQAFVPKRR